MMGNMGQESFAATRRTTEKLTEVISNISNIQTVGYKRDQVDFYQTLNGEVERSKTKDFSQGRMRKTGDPLDIAIQGKGLIEVELPNGGRAYTRVGSFQLTGEGELVTKEGYRVLPRVEHAIQPPIFVGNNKNDSVEIGVNLKVSSPKLVVPAKYTPHIDEDGVIWGVEDTNDESIPQAKVKLGKISVVVFNNTDGLEPIGKSYFAQTKASGAPQEIETGMNSTTQIKQGFIEGSNVDMAQTFMELSQVKNMLAAHLKILKAVDKIYESMHYTISKNA